MANMADFPQRLREARENAGLNKSELAREIFVRYDSILRWEAGTHIPSADNIALLCEALNVSADWLLGLSDKKKAPRMRTHSKAQMKKHHNYHIGKAVKCQDE